ncbi:MAG: Holliday junction branch migration protein RuvA [Beijerinckiaceae bacterium]
MIGKLKGLIDSYGEDFVVIDVNGVGYVAFCSARTLQALPRPGEAAVLAIETYVREDQIRLFGFSGDAERDWFRLLLAVQGVGPKVALAILSTFKAGELASAIALRDVTAITRAPGVGKKLAERLVLDLKDKAPGFSGIDPLVAKLAGAAEDARQPQPALEAISALANLGYPPQQASAAVSAAIRIAGDNPKTEALIRLALKEMVR